MQNNTLVKWEEKKLGTICDILDSIRKPITKKDRIKGPYPYYGATGLQDYVADYLFDEELVLIGEDGAKWGAGENTAYVINGKTWVNNHAHVVRPFALTLNSKFLVYYLGFTDLKSYITGATVEKLNQEKLKSIKIPLPPLEEQERIVKILDEAFENIDKAKQHAQQNLNNAKELFESYLDKVLTENSESWNKYKIKDVCKYVKEQGHYNLPYVGMEHIESATAKFIGTLDNVKVKSTTFHFNKGIILYGRLRPYLRKVILTQFEGHCSTELFPIKVNELVLNKYLMYWFLSQRITDKINATWTGARMPRANMNQVLEFNIYIPSIQDQQKIVAQLDELQAETKKLEAIYEQKIKDLDELKQSILQKAFNGEL